MDLVVVVSDVGAVLNNGEGQEGETYCSSGWQVAWELVEGHLMVQITEEEQQGREGPHFCSSSCRNYWESRRQRRAAATCLWRWSVTRISCLLTCLF